MKSIHLSLFALTVFSAAALRADEAPAVLIKRDLKPGKTYTQSMTMEQNMESKLGGVDNKMTMKMGMESTMTISKHETPGNKVLSMKYQRMTMDMDSGGQKIHVDSSKPSDDPQGKAMLESLKPVLEAKIVAVMDANNKVVELKGMEKLGGPMGGMFNKDSFNQMLSMANLNAPDRPVKAGETWPMETTMNMAGMGTVVMKGECKYEKSSEVSGVACAQVSLSGTISFDMDGAGTGAEGAPTAEQMKAMGMKMSGKFSGTVDFDTKANVERKTDMTMEMTMTMNNPQTPGESMTMPIKQHIVQEIKMADSE